MPSFFSFSKVLSHHWDEVEDVVTKMICGENGIQLLKTTPKSKLCRKPVFQKVACMKINLPGVIPRSFWSPAEMFAMYNSFHACVDKSFELYIISKIPKGRMLKKRIVYFFHNVWFQKRHGKVYYLRKALTIDAYPIPFVPKKYRLIK